MKTMLTIIAGFWQCSSLQTKAFEPRRKSLARNTWLSVTPCFLSVLLFPEPTFSQTFDPSDRDYELFSGDFNGDSLTDLYIREKPRIIILHGDIATPIKLAEKAPGFVLLQDVSGQTFSIEDNTETLSGLPGQKTSIELYFADFNVDGFLDVLISGVSTVINGASDQIIYSPGPPGITSYAARSVDAELKEFAEDAYSWFLDRDYFEDNAPLTTAVQTVVDFLFLAEWCATPDWVQTNGPLSLLPPIPPLIGDTLDEVIADNANFVAHCNFTGRTVIHYDLITVQYQIPIGSRDYSVFSRSALDLREVFEGMLESGVFIPNSDEIALVRIILEDILNVEIFGGIFGSGTGVFDPNGAGMDEVQVVPWLLANLQTASQPVRTPITTAKQHITVNPLPGAWITKKDWAPPATCGTSDGRFDTGTKYRGTPHLGVDLGQSPTTPVLVGTDTFAAGNGQVRWGANPGGWGDYLVIYHTTYPGIRTLYAHLSARHVADGNNVAAGDAVAGVGRTGYDQDCGGVKKTHLHFEVIVPKFRSKGKGRVDPQLFFQWMLEP